MLSPRRWWLATLMALFLASGIAVSAVDLSRDYYRVAPFHHDSAASRMYAVKLHARLESDGLAAALRQVLATRDGLEPTIRLLVAPNSLRWLRGHLVIGIPLLALFLALVVGYVGERSGSTALACAAPTLLLPFMFIHDPIRGFSDFWRESIAAWLLGAAVLCWFLSGGLRRRGWGTACGALLGSLFLARTVAGVYASLLFFPPLLVVAVRELRAGGDTRVRRRLLWLVGAAAAGALATAALSGAKLHSYYFVTAWDYGTRSDVFRFLAKGAAEALGLGALVLLMVLVAATVLARRRWTCEEWLGGLWLVAGLPLVIVLSGGLYHGAFALHTPLFAALGAAALARCGGPHARALAAAVILVSITSGLVQREITRRDSLATAQGRAAHRRFYEELTEATVVANPTVRYGFLFDALDTVFFNHAYFDRGILPTGTVSFHTVRDSYYRNAFPGLTAQQAAHINQQRLEADPGTLAVAFCDAASVPRSLAAEPFSYQAAVAVTNRLSESRRWRARRRFSSPLGCLYLYELADGHLSPLEKWEDVAVRP